ncbi:MAG: sigma-70 family RNA polymerase sigma factor [Clostridia bacterium]|nr:sigma-70 family RNA polymerase sigma factor [Clostridia bacterium]
MSQRDFDSIYNEYSRLVYWAAYRVVAKKEPAEDITQQVFERVFLNFDKVSELADPQLKSWLYRVSTNLALDTVRRAKHELLSDEPVGAEVVDNEPLAEEALIRKKRQEAVRKAIEKLDETNRKIITLHYFSEMTVNEISSVTGISSGTIKSRLVRARNLLAEMLEDEISEESFVSAMQDEPFKDDPDAPGV